MPRKHPRTYLSQLRRELQIRPRDEIPGAAGRRRGRGVTYEPLIRRPDEQIATPADPVGGVEVRAAVLKLPEPDRSIIEAHFGFNGPEESLRVIGRRIGLTGEGVRHREKAAIRKLKKELEGSLAPS
jgi:hypothetical protein